MNTVSWSWSHAATLDNSWCLRLQYMTYHKGIMSYMFINELASYFFIPRNMIPSNLIEATFQQVSKHFNTSNATDLRSELDKSTACVLRT